MRIAIGNDHGGFVLKNSVAEYVRGMGHEVVNFGTDSDESVDYPVYAEKVANAVASGDCDRGILICGTGIGISIAANKVRGIRCALCSEPVSARLSREHNNANIVAFGGRVIGPVLAEAIVEAFLTTDFQGGGRHGRRVDLIAEIEKKQSD